MAELTLWKTNKRMSKCVVLIMCHYIISHTVKLPMCIFDQLINSPLISISVPFATGMTFAITISFHCCTTYHHSFCCSNNLDWANLFLLYGRAIRVGLTPYDERHLTVKVARGEGADVADILPLIRDLRVHDNQRWVHCGFAAPKAHTSRPRPKCCRQGRAEKVGERQRPWKREGDEEGKSQCDTKN